MSRSRVARSALLALIAATTLTGTGHGAVAAAAPAVPYDDALVAVGRSVPEFAGVWMDADGSLVVSLTRPGEAIAARARDELARRLGRPDLAGAAVRVRPARYAFTDLKAWHDAISSDVLGLSGAVLIDVDERRNVVRVGLTDAAAATPAVQAIAAARGVPAGALAVEHADPVVTESLRDPHLPAVGGLEIGWTNSNDGGLYICTLGFPAIRGGVAGFVTNSHCTSTRGVVESTVHTQPSIAGQPIGVEQADPWHFIGGACPAGRVCRYSDSAFSSMQSAALYDQGFIAQPPNGSYAWDGVSKFRITGEANPVLGEVLTKVGRTTGRSSGSVGATCTTYNVFGSSLTMLCQGQAAYGSAGGDSGSPVFAGGGDVTLKGIHWGSSGVFSPIGNIQLGSELGSVQTCAPGFGC